LILRIDEQKTKVYVEYLDVKYYFYHLTSAEYQYEYLSKFEMKIRGLMWLGISLGVMALALCSAYLIRKKAVYFDIDLSYLIIFLLICVDMILIVATLVFFISLKLFFYILPWWVYFFFSYIISTIVFIKALNPDRNYIALMRYDIEALRNQPFRMPVSYDEKMFMDKGFAASLIRLFSRQAFKHSIRVGEFIHSKKTVRHVMSEAKAQQLIEKGENIFKIETVSENKVIVYKEIETAVFKEGGKYQWSIEDENKYNFNIFSKELHCKNFRVTHSHFNMKWYHYTINTVFFIAATLFIVLYNPNDTNSNLVVFNKIVIATLAGLIILTVLRFAAVPGFVEIEPAELQATKEILFSIRHLRRVEKLSERISHLEEENFDLRSTMKKEIHEKATDYSEAYIDKLLPLMEGEKDNKDNKD